MDYLVIIIQYTSGLLRNVLEETEMNLLGRCKNVKCSRWHYWIKTVKLFIKSKTDTQTDIYTAKHTNIQTSGQIYRQADRHADKQTDIQTNRQIYTQADRHTDKQIYSVTSP